MKLFFLRRLHGLSLIIEGISYFLLGRYPYINKTYTFGVYTAILISREMWKRRDLNE